MRNISAFTLLACIFWINVSNAADLTILQPDGSPAAGAKLYRALANQGAAMSMMGGGYGDEMMGGYGEMDAYGGGEGSRYEMGGMGGMDMGMGTEMEMGEMYSINYAGSSSRRNPVFTFLNGNERSRLGTPLGEMLGSKPDGTIELSNHHLTPSRGVISHSAPTLVVHESGVSFVPALSKFSPTLKLRSYGKLMFKVPVGVDPTKYQILTCWQNGFAFPSLDQYSTGMMMDESDGKPGVNRNDWRFKPQFRWFQTAEFGETISVPPGEIRATIIPKRPDGYDLQELTGEALFQLLISGGPSQIIPTSGRSVEPTMVEFGALRSLVCQVPKKQTGILPEWGDEPVRKYRLVQFKRGPLGDSPMLGLLSAKDLASTRDAAEFLNRNRGERSLFQESRLPTATNGNQVRFDLLRPGWYLVNQLDESGIEIGAIPIVDWEHQDNVAVATLAEGKIKGIDGTFQLLVSAQGVTTFQSSSTDQLRDDEPAASEPIAGPEVADMPTDAEKLKLVRALRRDVEATIEKLVKHRDRLRAMEASLGGSTGQQESAVEDPFGAGPVGADPFGEGSGIVGPDDSSDPFGGSGDTQEDPFG